MSDQPTQLNRRGSGSTGPAVPHDRRRQGDVGARSRRVLQVRGRVQGVGFRPFVCRLATSMNLAGWVRNDVRGAEIEVEGPADQIAAFARWLEEDLPAVARIDRIEQADRPVQDETVFRIVPSAIDGPRQARMTPDLATCEQCLSEVRNPNDRRFGYPFTNCTYCGPRYSIIHTVPYDRVNTTMSIFTMCPVCQAEYDDPLDRRFHAQPNACPVCGPRLMLVDPQGQAIAGDPIGKAIRMLQDGCILAIKGLGGMHLACRADLDEAVEALRQRKGREAKPLAMMVPEIETAKRLAEVDPIGAALLMSPARPIVLLPKRADAPISGHIAPGCSSFGVMLPYTPMHTLLFDGGLGPLVMTSGNPSAEPLCRDNDEAVERLSHIADALLLHDRAIARRVDDSVVMTVRLDDLDETQQAAGEPPANMVPLRRARGYVPEPIHVSRPAPVPILAVGAELKSTICVLRHQQAMLSEHLGDLTNPAACRHFMQTIESFCSLLDVEPQIIACDMHPAYTSTRYARTLGKPVIAVQHHHAHMVSCMVEHELDGPVVGIIADGTGYGTDGSVWGCEILVGDAQRFNRAAHLRPFALIGGDAAAIDTWRPALALVNDAIDDVSPEVLRKLFPHVDEQTLRLNLQRLRTKRATSVTTSSLGRLFDAVAALLGLCDANTTDGQAPMAVEAAAETAAREGDAGTKLSWNLIEPDDPDVPLQIDLQPMIQQLAQHRLAGLDPGPAALGFHQALAEMLAEAGAMVAKSRRITRIVLSGGCFANRRLLKSLHRALRKRELEVYHHHLVPPGDGGIALGQAAVAAAQIEQE